MGKVGLDGEGLVLVMVWGAFDDWLEEGVLCGGGLEEKTDDEFVVLWADEREGVDL